VRGIYDSSVPLGSSTLIEQADLAAISGYLQFGSLSLVTGSEELDGFFRDLDLRI
jgi:hypothetical protein